MQIQGLTQREAIALEYTICQVVVTSDNMNVYKRCDHDMQPYRTDTLYKMYQTSLQFQIDTVNGQSAGLYCPETLREPHPQL